MAHVVTGAPLALLLENEKKYSVRNMVNILHHMNLTYEAITMEGNSFHENTNVLAYVVLGAILMYHDFLSGYIENKPISQMFDMTDPSGYVRFIHEHYNSIEFLNAVHHNEQKPIKYKTTTMSLTSFV
jgi:hypothetical protein